MSLSLDVLLLATGWTHVLIAPYTKVEESFNLHATHDVLTYGVGPTTLHSYDHFVFPGAVPRTFFGSVLLAWLSTPAIRLSSGLGLISTKFDVQMLVRLVLATLNAIGLCLLRRAVSRHFGRSTSLFFVLLTCSQFHLPFWMGRTLPNMFALFPVNVATYLILDRAPNAHRPSSKNLRLAIALLTFTTVVFRAEVLLLLGPLVLQYVFLGYISLTSAVLVGSISGLVSLGSIFVCALGVNSCPKIAALTVLVDSYFWDTWPLWPEFAGIYFNIYQGKSSEWGTSPPHTYVTTHLPKLLLTSAPLSAFGSVLDSRIRTLLVFPLAFVTLISCLGHKEWRFVVYVVPVFNIAAAKAAQWMASRRKSFVLGRLLFVVALATIFLNLVITSLLTKASVANYPGGQALLLFNTRYASRPNVHVHISNLAAQTGASLFLQTHTQRQPAYLLAYAHGNWTYDKTESLSPRELAMTTGITHVITEFRPDGRTGEWDGGWSVVESVMGFKKWMVDFGALKGKLSGGGPGGGGSVLDVVRMEMEEKLWIVERVASG